MFRASIHRPSLVTAMRQLRPWIKKNRNKPLRSTVRLLARDSHIELLAGTAAGQGRVEIPATVHRPGIALVDAFGLHAFAQYAQGDWLTLVATDGHVVVRSEVAQQQVSMFRAYPADAFPDLERDGLVREPLHLDEVPDPDVQCLFFSEYGVADFATWLALLDFPVRHPTSDHSDTLMVQSTSRHRNQVDWLALHPDHIFLFRHVTEERKPSTFQLSFSRRSWKRLRKVLSDETGSCRVDVFPSHATVTLPSAGVTVFPVLNDLDPLPNPAPLFQELKATKAFRGAAASAAQWWEFFSALEPFVELFPTLTLHADHDMWRYALRREDGCSVENAIAPEPRPGWKPFSAEFRTDVAVGFLQRLVSAEPEAEVFFTYRKDMPRLHWVVVLPSGQEIRIIQNLSFLAD